MSTSNITSTFPTTGATDGTSASRAEDRARLADLAAEFESLLLNNVLRDMRSSGRWSVGGESDTLGAETFDQTIDVELSRYLSQAGGLGLSRRLMSAFDALDRITAAADASTAAGGASAGTSNAGTSTSSATRAATSGLGGSTASSGRTGWGGLSLEAPGYGGSGAEYGGFNNDRAMAGGDDQSVKDAFFRWTYGQSFNPAGKTKEEITAFFRDNVQSAREYGLNILDVQTDQILIETQERGAEWVDVVGSAGTAEAKWQWLCQTDFGVTGGGALGDALANLRGSADGDARVRALLTSTTMTGEGLLASLRAEVTAASTGGTFVTPQVTQGTPAQTTVAAAPEALRAQTAAITSAYGWRQDPFSGATTFHRGVDLRADEGDPVASTGPGRVTFSGTDGGYGTSVVVEHANGLTTRYAHLSSTSVNVGDEVSQGQVLGLVGQTGRATAPHLHYEVRVGGRAVDPLQE